MIISEGIRFQASSGFLFREGRRDDDEQIRALMKSVSMPGPIALTADCDPSFFDAVEIEGHDRYVFVVEVEKRLVGLGMVSKRRVYLNGIPTDVGYLSNLRSDPSVRGRAIVMAFNQFIDEWLKSKYGVPFYLSAILKNNLRARKALEGGRINFLQVKEIGRLYNAAIPLLKRPCPKTPAGVRMVRGDAVGAEAIAEFLNTAGSRRQFFPVYTAHDIESDTGILRGLKLTDFHIAIRGDHITGTMACWNQSAFRRMMVTSYSGTMKWLKFLIAPVMKMLHLAPIPNPGDSFKSLHTACIAIENNDPDIFRLLLQAILYDRYKSGNTFVTAGLMEEDPLLPALKQFLHFPLSTCIYAFSREGLDAVNNLDSRGIYIEAAGL
jgi:hypothetical protein